MNPDLARLEQALGQLSRMYRALHDLREQTGGGAQYAVLAESPLDEIRRLESTLADLSGRRLAEDQAGIRPGEPATASDEPIPPDPSRRQQAAHGITTISSDELDPERLAWYLHDCPIHAMEFGPPYRFALRIDFITRLLRRRDECFDVELAPALLIFEDAIGVEMHLDFTSSVLQATIDRIGYELEPPLAAHLPPSKRWRLDGFAAATPVRFEFYATRFVLQHIAQPIRCSHQWLDSALNAKMLFEAGLLPFTAPVPDWWKD